MAETRPKGSPWALFGWLSIVFVVGNLVFTNIFLQFVGLIGLPLGIGVSGSLTLIVFFVLRQRSGAPGQEGPEASLAARMARKIGLALLIAGGGSILYGVYTIVHSILARRLGLGVFEPNLAPFFTLAGLLVLSVGILLLAIPKPAQGSRELHRLAQRERLK
ncbi:MAG: hypothetical protein V3U30_00010 [Thermoplasmata archaeon]